MEEKTQNDGKSILALILGVGLLGMMGGALMGPVLPALSEKFLVGSSRVGLVITVYAAATALTFSLMGFLTDKYGRKKVIIPALFINGAAGIIGALAPNFSVLLIARAVQGVGIAGMVPMALVLIGDLYRGNQKASAMGSLSSTRSAGGIIAPLLGGGLASLDWRFAFLVYAASIPLALILWFRFPFPNGDPSISIREYLKPLKKAVKNHEVQAVLFMNFLSFFLVYTVVTFTPQRLVSTFGMSEAIAGAFLSVQAVATISIAIQSGRLVNLAPKKYLIGLGFLVSGLGFLILPTWEIISWIAFSLIIFGLGRGLYQPQVNTLVTDVAPKGRLGGIASVNNIARYAGQMVAPFFLGIVKTFTSFSVVFRISGLIGIAMGIGTLSFVISGILNS